MKMFRMDHNTKIPSYSISQHVGWVDGYVGKIICVVIPACAISCIRAHFPSPGDEENLEFTGFKHPDLQIYFICI